MRAVGLRGADVMSLREGRVAQQLLNALNRMGQPYQAPPGPDGWPDRAEAWIHPHGVAARIGWAMALTRHLPGGPPDPRQLVQNALGEVAGNRLRFAAEAAESRADGVALILASAQFNRR